MTASLTCEQAQELYYYLRLTRSLEEMLARLFRQNKVFGGLYSSLGQEAVSVAPPRAQPATGSRRDPQYRGAAGAWDQATRVADAAHGPRRFAHSRQRRHVPGDLRTAHRRAHLHWEISLACGVYGRRYLGHKSVAS
jgi:hypothetical protein